MDRNFHKDKKIDRFNLHEECETQADKYHFWAKEAAIEKENRDNSKTALKKLEGKTVLKIMQGKYKLPLGEDKKPIKVTNPVLNALIDADEDICVAREELATAERVYSQAAAREEGMQQRRSSLNNLVSLFEKEYWAPVHEGKSPGYSREDDKAINQKTALNKRKKKAKED